MVRNYLDPVHSSDLLLGGFGDPLHSSRREMGRVPVADILVDRGEQSHARSDDRPATPRSLLGRWRDPGNFNFAGMRRLGRTKLAGRRPRARLVIEHNRSVSLSYHTDKSQCASDQRWELAPRPAGFFRRDAVFSGRPFTGDHPQEVGHGTESRGDGQLDDRKPRLSEDDITRALLGPRGVVGKPDTARMTPQQEKNMPNYLDPGHTS